MDKHQNLAENLRQIRRARQMTLAEFSAELGIPKSTLQSVLTDGQTTLDTAMRIADGLHIPLDTLASIPMQANQVQVMQALARCLNWFAALSEAEQQTVADCLRQIVRIIRK